MFGDSGPLLNKFVGHENVVQVLDVDPVTNKLVSCKLYYVIP